MAFFMFLLNQVQSVYTADLEQHLAAVSYYLSIQNQQCHLFPDHNFFASLPAIYYTFLAHLFDTIGNQGTPVSNLCST